MLTAQLRNAPSRGSVCEESEASTFQQTPNKNELSPLNSHTQQLIQVYPCGTAIQQTLVAERQVLDSEGTVIRTIDIDGLAVQPSGVVVAPTGVVYVTDGHSGVVAIDPADGVP
jgi:DNA-binding beta-propeller fold protein YncE